MGARTSVGSQYHEPSGSILTFFPDGDSFWGNSSDFPAKFPLLSNVQLDLVSLHEPASPGSRIWVRLPEKLGAAVGAGTLGQVQGLPKALLLPRL